MRHCGGRGGRAGLCLAGREVRGGCVGGDGGEGAGVLVVAQARTTAAAGPPAPPTAAPARPSAEVTSPPPPPSSRAPVPAAAAAAASAYPPTGTVLAAARPVRRRQRHRGPGVLCRAAGPPTRSLLAPVCVRARTSPARTESRPTLGPPTAPDSPAHPECNRLLVRCPPQPTSSPAGSGRDQSRGGSSPAMRPNRPTAHCGPRLRHEASSRQLTVTRSRLRAGEWRCSPALRAPTAFLTHRP